MSGGPREPVLERDVVITNIRGLHPRAATAFVELARRHQARIMVLRDRQLVDGKDIWDLLTLGAEKGTALKLRAHGPDAAQALEALAALIDAKFNEGE